MGTAERVRQLEDEVEDLKAIVDGSEAHTHEAFVSVLGLVLSFLGEKRRFEFDELAAYLAGSADTDYRAEDHCGQMIHRVRQVVEFHRDRLAGTARVRRPASAPLGPRVAARAAEEVATGRSAGLRGRGRGGAGQSAR